MRKLAIVHFNPIEQYPPVLNWLGFLAAGRTPSGGVRVYTLRRRGRAVFDSGSENIGIYRFAAAGFSGLRAWYNYSRFGLLTLFQLIRWRPDTVLYYETPSVLPVYVYMRFFNRRTRLFIHFHEYTSPMEYASAGAFIRWAHRLEKRLFPRAEWISHTNTDRIALFQADMAGIDLPDVRPLPNYPPCTWLQTAKRERRTGAPLKLVYVGALSLETMYTRELAEWIAAQDGAVTWDIYSNNVTAGAKAYLSSLDSRLIRFREAVDYYELPSVLPDYDIGVIIYTGHIPNYVYNAPNKLFEYMVCGLDVWFPAGMKGCLPYVTSGTYPQVAAIDFERPGSVHLSAWAGSPGLRYLPHTFCCDQVYGLLYGKMEGKL